MPIQLSGNGLITTANATFSNTIVMSNNALLATANAGFFEYSANTLYFTPSGTQRGVVPGQQMFVLNTAFVGQNINTVQPVFNVGVTLSANTTYAFDAVYAAFKTAGTTAHTIGFGFGGTATLSSTSYFIVGDNNSGGFPSTLYSSVGHAFVNTATNSSFIPSTATAAVNFFVRLSGTVSINAGGTFIPQYTLSAAPGGTYTTVAGSYFSIYPVAASSANVSIGTWA